MVKPIIILLFSFFSVPVMAAPQADLKLGTTLISLFLVLGLILALSWVVKRLKVPGLPNGQSGMRIISQLAVGQKERVMVVEVNKEQVLIGVTGQQITLLKTLNEPMEAPATPTSFSEHLNQILKKNENV
ncbi:flagellar biosynthetic protein FliO [Veronia pacifica]|uniref:Flagellar protein n=1 Tax=Veronia pacifica TaxID=1080227 RepID=A0A1C3EED9_9GAMM|nr:flagellar biosynthetic protein FliO [Veronia pacifica]ODA31611.1 flagellar biosynthetic protein FliO [Veronia pacifica]